MGLDHGLEQGEDRLGTVEESLRDRVLGVLTRDELELVADFVTGDARGFLAWIIDDACEVSTGDHTLVFRYERPIHRDVARRWVLARRGELPDGE